jgi:hypothetical protein
MCNSRTARREVRTGIGARTRRETPTHEPSNEALGRRELVRACFLVSCVLSVGCVSNSKPAPAPGYSDVPGPSAGSSADSGHKPPILQDNKTSEAALDPAGSEPAPPGQPSSAKSRIFASNTEAIRYVVETYRPRILGFGEAHATSTSKSRSTARRFADSILPELAPQSNFLLVELLSPPANCEAPRKEVQKESDTITEGQASTNQNEYFELGHRARKLGVLPDILRPSCSDFQAIASAGDEAVLRMMETIGRLSAQELSARFSKAPPARPLILAYGGALHNDITPSSEFASWSYGPELGSIQEAKYLEVDLLVPEGLATSAWSRLAWFPEAARALEGKQPTEAGLWERSPSSLVLILAEEPLPSDEPGEQIQR